MCQFRNGSVQKTNSKKSPAHFLRLVDIVEKVIRHSIILGGSDNDHHSGRREFSLRIRCKLGGTPHPTIDACRVSYLLSCFHELVERRYIRSGRQCCITQTTASGRSLSGKYIHSTKENKTEIDVVRIHQEGGRHVVEEIFKNGKIWRRDESGLMYNENHVQSGST